VADRDEIIGFCDELLEIEAFEDYGPNGLQIPGSGEVTKVATGVSAQLELFERAVEAGAELLLTHHGTFWESQPRELTEAMASRLRVALNGELSLAAYHLPLDAHPEIGNNSLLCRGLGFEPGDAFALARGRPIGLVGSRTESLGIGELQARVAELVGRDPLVFDAGPERIGSIGIVSGSASGYVHDAIALGLDAFLTGEPSEHVMADAREGRIHYLAAGHYATETFGIRRLGDLVAQRFGVEHEFIDVPNPI
jgi:dinuclear metal center YbgI/SA1388 family protein